MVLVYYMAKKLSVHLNLVTCWFLWVGFSFDIVTYYSLLVFPSLPVILGLSGTWFSMSYTTYPLNFYLLCASMTLLHAMLKAVPATARVCFTIMWLCSCCFGWLPGIWALISRCPSRKESWSVFLPSLPAPQKGKRLHRNSPEASARHRGGWWAYSAIWDGGP